MQTIHALQFIILLDSIKSIIFKIQFKILLNYKTEHYK